MNPVSSCPICFEALSDKIKASPDNCEHIFCLPCLEKWSKLGSYCPVDRKRFKKILNLDADVAIQVKSHKRKRRRTVYDFTVHCELCSSITDSNVLLLCDCCDLGYHIHCLKPPLKEVPAGLWFCPTCISVEERLKKKNGITKEVEAELGGFNDKLLYKTKCKEKVTNEKISMVKAKKLNNSEPVKKENFQTCYDIISNFEDMIVRKKHCEDAGSSRYLDSTINKIDKIYKSFDIASKDFKIKHLKTYSNKNTSMKTKKNKSCDVGKVKKSYPEPNSINFAVTCLNENSLSSDVNLQNPTLSVSLGFPAVVLDDDDNHSKDEKSIKQLNSNIDYNHISLFSEASDILSDEFYENSPQREKQNVDSPTIQFFEDTNSFVSENVTVFDKNVKLSSTGKSLEKMSAIHKNIDVTAKRKSFDNMPVLDKNVKITPARKSLEKMSAIHKNVELTAKRKLFENIPVLEKNVGLTVRRKSFEKVPVLEKTLRGKAEKFLTVKQQEFNRTVIASNAEDSIPSSSWVRDKFSKEKCVDIRESDIDSAKFQPRVVLSRINLSDTNLNFVPISHSSCTLTSSKSYSYNFQASASDKLIKTNEDYMSAKVVNSSKCLAVSTHVGRKDSSSDNESENSDFSDHSEIYNCSLQRSRNLKSSIYKRLFPSDIEDDFECNQDGGSTSFNENKDHSVDINHEKSLSSDTDEECNQDGDSASFNENKDHSVDSNHEKSLSSDTDEESECNNKNPASFSESENIFSSNQCDNSFSSDKEEEFDCNNYENSTSFNENIERSVEVQNETSPNSEKPLSRNALKYLAIRSDGSFYIKSSYFENCTTETESKAKNKPSSSFVGENYYKEVTQVHISNNEVRETSEESIEVQNETSPNSEKPLSRNALKHLAIRSDGSFYLKSSYFENCTTETESKAKNKPSSSFVGENYYKEVTQVHISNNEVRETSEESLSRSKTSTSEFHALSKNDESKLCKESTMPDDQRFMESASDDTYFHDSESSSDDKRLELNAEPLTNNAKPTYLTLSDLKYMAINPDGAFFIAKPLLKDNEADSQSMNSSLSVTQLLSEHNQCTVNCDSELSNQSFNFDFLNENENFTEKEEEEMFSERDSASGNHISQLNNESSISSTPLSQNEHSELSNQTFNFDFLNENENFTEEEEEEMFSERDSASRNHISQLNNESSITSTPLSQNEHSQLSNQTFNFDFLNENENFTEEEEEEMFSERDSASRNHISQLNNESSISSTPLSQNEHSQLNNKSVASNCVNETLAYEPEPLTNNAKPTPLSISDLKYAVNSDGMFFIAKPTLKANEADSPSLSGAQLLSEHNQCTVSCDSELSNQSFNFDFLNENENFMEEEEMFSERDSASKNAISQLNNESSITSTPLSQREHSELNDKSVASDRVNETLVYEPEPFSERDSGSRNHTAQLTNESPIRSTHLSQNEQSQFNNKSVTPYFINPNQTLAYESEPFCEDEIQITLITDKSAPNFRDPSENKQFASYQRTSKDISVVNASHVQKQPDNSKKVEMIHYEDSQFIIPKEDGLYLFQQ